MRTTLILTIALAVLSSPSVLVADDLNPPSYRGGPLSTSAEWDFLTDQSPESIQPDGTNVPLVVGDAAPILNAEFPTGAPYPSGAIFGDVLYSSVSNGAYRGGPTGDGILVFNVPNWIDEEPFKRLRLQVTYAGPAPGSLVIGFLGVPGTSSGVTVLRVDRLDIPTSNMLPPGMSYFSEDWQIMPNPDWEQVALFLHEGTVVDQVVIDTISGQSAEPGFIFFSGFETGDTGEWSTTVP